MSKMPSPDLAARVTRDLNPPNSAPMPSLSPFTLRTLASAIDRLMAFHAQRGGRLAELPLLERVVTDPDGEVTAHARSGQFHFRLVLKHAEWVLD